VCTSQRNSTLRRCYKYTITITNIMETMITIVNNVILWPPDTVRWSQLTPELAQLYILWNKLKSTSFLFSFVNKCVIPFGYFHKSKDFLESFKYHKNSTYIKKHQLLSITFYLPNLRSFEFRQLKLDFDKLFLECV
jgi:hypothetical protein